MSELGVAGIAFMALSGVVIAMYALVFRGDLKEISKESRARNERNRKKRAIKRAIEKEFFGEVFVDCPVYSEIFIVTSMRKFNLDKSKSLHYHSSMFSCRGCDLYIHAKLMIAQIKNEFGVVEL